MPTMNIQVTVELTPAEVAWFVREADYLGCTFEEAISIHCNEKMTELVQKYSVGEGAKMAEKAVARAAENDNPFHEVFHPTNN